MKRIIIIVILCVFTINSFSQTGKWKKAQKINTIEYYKDFLIKYPESEFKDDAIVKLMELEYEKAKGINSIESYSSFLATYEKYKNSVYDKARNDLMDIEFEDVTAKKNIDACELFLHKYSDEKYRFLVEKMLDSLSFAEAQVINTWRTYEEYINKFGKDAIYYKVASDNAEELLYQEIMSVPTISICEHFIISYPKSGHQEEIKSKLSKLKEVKNKEDIELYFKEAKEFAEMNNSKGAISSLDKIIALDNKNLRAFSWRGYIRYFEKNYQGSIDDYLMVIELTDDDTTLTISYANVAFSFLNLGNNSQALIMTNKMVAARPNFSLSYYNRAAIEKRLEKKNEAIKDLTKAIQLNSKYVDAYAMRGELYADMNNNSAAISDFRKVINIEPNYELPSEYIDKYESSIFTKKEIYVGTIEAISQSYGVTLSGLTSSGFQFWLKEYDKVGFDIDQETALKWGLVTHDKNSSFLNLSSKGWKVEFTTSNQVNGRGNNEEKGDYVTKEIISFRRLP